MAFARGSERRGVRSLQAYHLDEKNRSAPLPGLVARAGGLRARCMAARTSSARVQPEVPRSAADVCKAWRRSARNSLVLAARGRRADDRQLRRAVFLRLSGVPLRQGADLAGARRLRGHHQLRVQLQFRRDDGGHPAALSTLFVVEHPADEDRAVAGHPGVHLLVWRFCAGGHALRLHSACGFRTESYRTFWRNWSTSGTCREGSRRAFAYLICRLADFGLWLLALALAYVGTSLLTAAR